MGAKITPFPGDACAFFLAGRCVLAERQNPGLDPGIRCKVLLGWESAWDDFLTRADAFGLEERTAARIWEDRLRLLVESGPDCAEFAAGPDTEATGCAHSREDLCLMRLPACAGRCKDFRARDDILFCYRRKL
jgi:hypothetical protein